MARSSAATQSGRKQFPFSGLIGEPMRQNLSHSLFKRQSWDYNPCFLIKLELEGLVQEIALLYYEF